MPWNRGANSSRKTPCTCRTWISSASHASEEGMNEGVPQFATAEYSATGGEACKACGQPLSGAYYQISGAKTCAQCAQRIKDQLPKDSHAAFARGLLFGVGGAILGLGIY